MTDVVEMNIGEKEKHFSYCKVWANKDCDCYEAALEQCFILERSIPKTSTRKSIKVSGFIGTPKEFNEMLDKVNKILNGEQLK